MSNPLQILALLSDPLLNPNGQPVDRLGLDQEVSRVRRQLAALNRAADLHLLIATPDNLLNTLRDHGPFDLLHFTGHGSDGLLAFEDGQGGTFPLDAMRLQAIFTPLGQPPCQVAFLSACHSESMAQALLAAGVPHVVAIDGDMAVFDVAARAFAAHFYPALLAGKTVRQAFEFGRAAVLTDPDTLKACRLEAGRNPALAELVNLLTGQQLPPPDALNRLEALKFKLLPEPPSPLGRGVGGEGEADPHAIAPFPTVPTGPLTLFDLPPYPETLGASLDYFTGRAADWRHLIGLVRERRLTTILGFGGMGKSALAREVGRWFARRNLFPGGITFIALGNRARAEEARLTIAAELKLNPAVTESDRSLARALPPDSLLILDELDSLCAEEPRPTRALFEALRDYSPAHVLATSRQATGAAGEQRYELVHMPAATAEQLFLRLAYERVSEIRGSRAELQEVLQFLDGYPRAIVQAARQMFSPDLSALLADLRRAKEEILHDPDLPPEELRDHESVLITLNSSLRRLQQRDPDAAAFFPLLAMFPAGLSEAGLVEIFGPAARRQVRTIKELSLLELSAPLDYYYLPAPVRSFAERRLPATALGQYGPAALSHFSRLAGELASLLTSGQIELGVVLTSLELPNLYYWLDWGYDGEQTTGDEACLTARITASLRNFYTMMPLLRAEAQQRSQRALASAFRLQDRAGQANTLQSLGDLAMRVDDLKGAAQRYEAALTLFSQIDAKLGQANTLVSQAKVFDIQGNLEQALKNLEIALGLFQSFDDIYSIALGLGVLGEIWLRNNQPESGYRTWAQRLMLIVTLDPALFGQMASRTINMAKNHARAQPDQAANGCAALLGELQNAKVEAEERQALLGLTADIFRVISLAAQAAGQSGPEQAETLAQAQTLAQQVDEATNSAFGLAAWLDEREA